MRWAILLVGVAVVAGCASFPPRPAPVPVDPSAPPNAASGWRVSVEEFGLPGDVSRYDGPPEWIGVELAQQIADQLRRAGVRAEVSGLGSPAAGDVVIRGRVVEIDGGSSKARSWAPGAGAAWVRIEGEVVRVDGAPLGSFSRERRSARYQDSVRLVEACVGAIARDVALMVTTGSYTRD
jgi:hypothetical protein